MHASVAGAHAREVSGIRFRAIAVIGVPSVSISKSKSNLVLHNTNA